LWTKETTKWLLVLSTTPCCWLFPSPIMSAARVHRHHQRTHREVRLRCSDPSPWCRDMLERKEHAFFCLTVLCKLVVTLRWSRYCFPSPQLFGRLQFELANNVYL
jgi:hypothetical protein